MLPASVSVAAVLLALVPGWLYTQLRSQLSPRPPMSNLSELLGSLAVGLATTGVSVALVALIPHDYLPFLVDISAWSSDGIVYLQRHIRESILTVVVVLAIAVLIAFALYVPQRIRRPAEFSSNRTVWMAALGVRPKKHVPYLGVMLHEGDLIEGILHGYSTNERPPDERDLALSRPIRRTRPGTGEKAFNVDIERIVIPGREIAYITVRHEREKEQERKRRWWRGDRRRRRPR